MHAAKVGNPYNARLEALKQQSTNQWVTSWLVQIWWQLSFPTACFDIAFTKEDAPIKPHLRVKQCASPQESTAHVLAAQRAPGSNKAVFI